ncbi:hypothetical protein [Brevibacillus migulae]|uniref:hypothetical protein n=1 Tax=Brevibacillus migulae TaxID=1644114 RepID=UPI001431DB2E|nr:hypothetical protein [Brevibacillus migulae]
MPLWVFVVMSVAGILLIGAVYDFINKKKNKKVIVESRTQNAFDEITDPRSKDGQPF